MIVEEITFSSQTDPPVNLKGKIHYFDDSAKHPLAIVCHPSSQGLCNMDHFLVTEPCRLLNEAGFITLRFNFRGVAGSEGELTKGKDEPGDLLGALAYLETRSDVDWRLVYTVGHSFGGVVALKIAVEDSRVKGFASLGCPIMLVDPVDSYYFKHYELDVAALRHSTKHKLFVWGELDGYAARERQSQFIAAMPEPKREVAISGANHYFAEGDRFRPDPEMAGHAAQIVTQTLQWWRDQDLRLAAVVQSR